MINKKNVRYTTRHHSLQQGWPHARGKKYIKLNKFLSSSSIPAPRVREFISVVVENSCYLPVQAQTRNEIRRLYTILHIDNITIYIYIYLLIDCDTPIHTQKSPGALIAIGIYIQQCTHCIYGCAMKFAFRFGNTQVRYTSAIIIPPENLGRESRDWG